jgi:tetratricopeptide (TPR) repeat protein
MIYMHKEVNSISVQTGINPFAGHPDTIGEYNIEVLKLVYLTWTSEERDKYIWEDLYDRPWNEIIGRMYLLKANQNAGRMYLIRDNQSVKDSRYQDALADFEQALSLLVKEDVDKSYYACALADKALTQCFLGQYDTALATINQALTASHNFDEYYHNDMLNNRGAILVLTGAYSEALNALYAQLSRNPQDSYLRFTLATCLLHMERYSEAITAYEQVIAEDGHLEQNAGLIAACQGRQPDWANL